MIQGYTIEHDILGNDLYRCDCCEYKTKQFQAIVVHRKSGCKNKSKVIPPREYWNDNLQNQKQYVPEHAIKQIIDPVTVITMCGLRYQLQGIKTTSGSCRRYGCRSELKSFESKNRKLILRLMGQDLIKHVLKMYPRGLTIEKIKKISGMGNPYPIMMVLYDNGEVVRRKVGRKYKYKLKEVGG